MYRKKGQIWSFDLIAGVTVFTFMIVVYFIFSNNISQNDASNFNELYNDAIILSETLLSAGSPVTWNLSNVEEAGITNGDYRLNISKLGNLSSIDYSLSKNYLKTRFDYLVFFEDRIGEVIDFGGMKYIGKNSVTKDNIKSLEDPSTLISIKRFLIYGTNIVTMVIYVWE